MLGRDQDRGGELPTQPQVCPWFRSGEQKRRRILAPHTSPVIIDDASSSESRGTARLLVCKQTVTAERSERVLLSQSKLYIGIFSEHIYIYTNRTLYVPFSLSSFLHSYNFFIFSLRGLL